jgi:hypothetical protein
MRAAAFAAALLLLAFAHAPPQAAPSVVLADLAHARWTLDGREPPAPPALVHVDGEPPRVELPFTRMGQRWACEFSTAEPATQRLSLAWQGAPDGLLFEVVLDGQRLTPPRDGWRPTPKALSSDLGGTWLGRGAHLLEFVAREKPGAQGARLRLAVLEAGAP